MGDCTAAQCGYRRRSGTPDLFELLNFAVFEIHPEIVSAVFGIWLSEERIGPRCKEALLAFTCLCSGGEVSELIETDR